MSFARVIPRPTPMPVTAFRAIALALLALAGCDGGAEPFDLVLRGGSVLDGSGDEPVRADVAIADGRVAVVGPLADDAEADEVIDVTGLVVAPGFIDMHSHAELDEDYGRDGRPFLAQGITTVVMGVDGGGTHEVGATLERWRRNGLGVNALTYVGHGHVRGEVLAWRTARRHRPSWSA